MDNPFSDIKFHQQSRELELVFHEGSTARLTYEYLRVMTPSAEARGHSPAQAVIQSGCRQVGIERVIPVGNYAIQIKFDDGHETGIYSWSFLADLAQNQDRYWREYLDALMENGLSRDSKPPH